MGSRICMNTSCRATATIEWKKGWQLRSGQNSDLCFNCGSAYENLVYCDTFHSEESGWRECSLCNKRLHCGCSASVPFIEIQDFGGVWCISCAKTADSHSIQGDGITCEARPLRKYPVGDVQNIWVNNKLDGDTLDHRSLLSLGNIVEANEPLYLPQPQADDANGSFLPIKHDALHSMGTSSAGFPNLSRPPSSPLKFTKPNEKKQNREIKDMHESQFQPSLNISLPAPSEAPNIGVALLGGREEQKMKPPLFQPAPRPRHILPKLPKNNPTKVSDANKGSAPRMRVARPPAEGRLRNQLLPRYWPRITDQELQQLCGDLNSTIVPLFEKILSASDASRIGRLVLPKACAEAYFPPINQSEGLPLKIQDIKGNEWSFQFRFWPNNNSRMYVLEGVTPCIQSMQLQAGDTVTFSRIDPGGKLVIGFRKASTVVETQDLQTSAPTNGSTSGESLYSDAPENLPAMNGYSGIPKSMKGSTDDCPNALSEQLNLVNGNTGWNECEKFKSRTNENFSQRQGLGSGKKKTRNIGSKSKRLLMHSEEALELKLTWEETQELLHPPLNVQSTVVIIDGYEIEEYNEPPVFGRRTIFTTRLSGGQEQWAQCDKCLKWRKLPVDVLLPPKWTCPDNVWDSDRSSCSAPDEMSLKELDDLFRANKDFKKQKILESPELGHGREPSGLDALATAATLGEDAHDHELEEPSSGATTRHPRHRPGCTCIVCIQPPSGKGKHKPTCVCNVCMTVKRRFRTLMMRKKKRQYEREAEMTQQRNHDDSLTEEESQLNENMANEVSPGNLAVDGGGESSKGHIDLNSHPTREDDMQVEAPSCVSMMGLVQAASLPLHMYMEQNGIASLIYDGEEADLGSCLLEKVTGQSQGPREEHCVHVVGGQQHNDDDCLEEPSKLCSN
ncbi:hypothetical protein Ancab_007159 [Ancistrocladus abbreviatus]